MRQQEELFGGTLLRWSSTNGFKRLDWIRLDSKLKQAVTVAFHSYIVTPLASVLRPEVDRLSV